MDGVDDLRALLASRCALVIAEERDEQRFIGLLRQAGSALGLPLWTWSSAHGLARDGQPPQYGTVDPGTALEFVRSLTDPGVFVFLDPGPALGDPVLVRRLKELAQAAGPGVTLIFAGPHLETPPSLTASRFPGRSGHRPPTSWRSSCATRWSSWPSAT